MPAALGYRRRGLAWHAGQETLSSRKPGTMLAVPRSVRWSSARCAALAFAAASRSFTIGMIRSSWPCSRWPSLPPSSPFSTHSWPGRAIQTGQARRIQKRRAIQPSPALGLVLNAVALWNIRYLDAAVTELHRAGHTIADEHLARLSPLKAK